MSRISPLYKMTRLSVEVGDGFLEMSSDSKTEQSIFIDIGPGLDKIKQDK